MDSQLDAERKVTSVSPFVAMLRASLKPSALVGLVCAVVFFVVGGVAGGLSSLFGTALALGFFASGLLVLGLLKDLSPAAVMAVGMAVFLGQVILLGAILMVAGRVDALDGPATGITVAVVVVAWQIFQVRSFMRTRQFVYDPDAKDTVRAADVGGSGAT